MVLDALLELRRRGRQRAWEELEQVEPDLASYAVETLSVLHAGLLRLGGRAKQTARVLQQAESLVLVCVTALRRGGYEQWRQSAAGTPLVALDAAFSDGGPATAVEQASQPAEPPSSPPPAGGEDKHDPRSPPPPR
jgi:hypothetical protein